MHALAVFSNLFSGDGLIIFLFLLLFFGAKKLPELARGLGSAMREFSKAKDEIQHEITRPPQIESPRQTDTYVASTEEDDYHHRTSTPPAATTTAAATTAADEPAKPAVVTPAGTEPAARPTPTQPV